MSGAASCTWKASDGSDGSPSVLLLESDSSGSTPASYDDERSFSPACQQQGTPLPLAPCLLLLDCAALAAARGEGRVVLLIDSNARSAEVHHSTAPYLQAATT